MFVGLAWPPRSASSTARCAGSARCSRSGARLDLALVLPWFLAIIGRAGDAFFSESVGRDMLAKVARRRRPRRAARLLFRAVLADVLAGRDAGGAWRRRRSGRAARARRANSCWPGWCRPGSSSSW